MTRRKKRIVAATLIVGIPVAIALVCYIIVSIYYMNRFFPGTYINGIDFSGKSSDEVLVELEEYHSDYTFRITERGGAQEILNGKDIGHKIVFEGIKDLKKTQGFLGWPAHMSDQVFYTVEGDHGYDEACLKSALQNLDCMTKNVEEPQNAYVDYSNGVHIVDEVQGNKVEFDRLYEAVGQAINAGYVRLNIDKAGCYAIPEITRDSKEFKEAAAPVEKYTSLKITLKIGSKEEVLDEDIIEGFLVKNEDDTITVDQSKVRAYVDKIEEKYETWGKPHEFKTMGGEKVSLSGTLGWSINAKEETKQIMAELEGGKDVTREILYDSTAPTWEGNEIGDTYIEISIKDQKMWFHKDGKVLVETDVVTGCVNQGHSTPKGAYTIINKLRNQTLIGANPEDPYESRVSFWLPFIGNMYGIHDASWRGYFGGSIYIYNGSHGCVNTPYKKVQSIYENAEIGTPVLIY